MDTASLLSDFNEEVDAFGLEFIPESRLRLGRRLGSGTFSVVYEGELQAEKAPFHETLPIAIKELKTNRAGFQTQKNALLSEASLLWKLQHPNVVEYVGCGLRVQDQPKLFMAQELIKGGSLDAFIHKVRRRGPSFESRNPYSLQSALRWCIQTASAVCYLHSEENKVIHRDIKLSNLLLTDVDLSKSDVKLADFGLAVDASKIEYSQSSRCVGRPQRSGKTRGKSSKSWGRLWKFDLFKKTTDWVSIGSPNDDASVYNNCYDLSRKIGSYMYMSPEVYLGVPYNEKADIYSLGVLIAEILIGMPLSCCLLPERSYEEAKNFAFCVSRGLRLKCPKSFPKPLASVLKKCWNRDPSKRPTADCIMRVLQIYEGSCKNVERLSLFPPLSLSVRQKLSLSLGKVSSLEN